MIIKRVLSAFAAAAAVLTFSAGTVFADDAKDEKPVIKFEADGTMLSSDNVPAISFDTEKYEDYIHLTRDADKAGIKLAQDKDTYYQGASMKVSASTDGVDGYFNCSGMARDDDNNLLFPDAPETEDTSSVSIIGFELEAKDFGLTCFDGCMVTFAYRLTDADEKALMGQSAWVYPADEDNVRVSDMATQLKVNTTTQNNISQYQKAFVTVGEERSATKIIFDIPTSGAVKGTVFYIDNITIQLPDSIGDKKYIKNLDGYNENAEPREIIEELQVAKKGNTISTESEAEKSSSKTSPLIFVIIGVAVVVVAGAVFFIIKKLRNRFY